MSLVTPSPIKLRRALRVVERCQHDDWDLCGLSQRSPAKTTLNEDAAAIVPTGDHSMIVVVADGCGGMRGGERASALAIQTLCQAAESHFDQAHRMRGAILDGIEQANEAIQALKIGAATTIAVVECRHDRIRSYHVGDSMVLVASNRGRVRYQSICHSPVGYAVESGWLNENQALYHEDRHLVSNLVGSPRMRIEVGPWVKLARHDKVLVASDGLFDNLTLREVIRRLRSPDIDECVLRLSRLATKRMRSESDSTPSKPDDLTIVGFSHLRRTA